MNTHPDGKTIEEAAVEQSSPRGSQGGSTRRNRLALVLIGAAVLVIVVLSMVFNRGSNTPTAPAPAVSPTSPQPAVSAPSNAFSPKPSIPPSTALETPPVPVAREYYLHDLSLLEGKGNWDARAVNVNGTLYAKSVVANDIGTLNALGDTMEGQYNVARKCSHLTFTAGITDDSPADTGAQFEVYADDSLVYSAAVQFGSARPSEVPIQNALRVRLVVTPTTQTNLAAAFGDAKLTCQGALPTG